MLRIECIELECDECPRQGECHEAVKTTKGHFDEMSDRLMLLDLRVTRIEEMLTKIASSIQP